MNWRIIGALISKDVSLHFRNRIFAIVTPVGIIFYSVIYFLMPSSVNESLEIGLYATVVPPAFEQIQGEGLEIELVGSEESLREAVTEGQYVAGVALPADIMEKLVLGQKPQINVYFAADTPEEIKDAVQVFITELAYLQTGKPLAIEVSEEILGPDMLGMQIPPRNRLRPLFAFFLLTFEIMGLATLIGAEVGRRTIQALLVTPVTVRDLFAAKGITGVSLAFGQAAFLLAILGGVNREPLIVLATLLLGAVLVTGIGFVVGSMTKDMLSTMPWFLVIFIPLMIPAISIIFPGLITSWVKAIPSYYVVDTIHRAASFEAGWGDVWQSLLILLGFNIVIFWIGIMALGRKFR